MVLIVRKNQANYKCPANFAMGESGIDVVKCFYGEESSRHHQWGVAAASLLVREKRMSKRILVSIIIPVKKISDRFRQETIPAIFKQSYGNFEIIIVPDKKSKDKFRRTRIIPSWPKVGPADKRDLGAKKAKGEILAFIDDDVYPSKDWLKNAMKIFDRKKTIVAVCGPTLTPPGDNFHQRMAGYVWGSRLGSGGAGTHRYIVGDRQEVDDFPTANLLLRRKDFWLAGGFNTHFWSGEDTKLCLFLTKKIGKKIIYDPKVLVYHHRREVFGPHLRQIARYGLHRGHFVRILPQTSLRFGYLAPSLFVLSLFTGPILIFLNPFFLWFYLFSISCYFFLLFATAGRVFLAEKKLKAPFLVVAAIFSTHLVYGCFFIKGFLTKELKQ